MGNPSWGKGFHTGHAEGFDEGKTEGLILGLVFTAVGVVTTAVGSYIVHKHVALLA